MVAIKAGDKVLVTGASGFIAAHVTKEFLNEGFPVRGTVRSKAKGEYLVNLYKGSKVPFEYVLVEDIAQDGAFDEAVKGIDAVAHMASPFHFKADDPKELFEPAVKGTVGVLKSLQKNNPSAKRVVITSSVAAVVDSRITGYHVRDENDWNPVSIQVCEEKGREADGVNKYRASKTLAEKAFWDFLKDEKVEFDGVTVNPPLVLGPTIHQIDKFEDLNTSVANFASWATGKHKQEELPAPSGNYVDVRECAIAHVRALTVPEASGQRFLASAGPVSGNDFCVAINAYDSSLPNVPKGDASAREKINSTAGHFSGAKATKVLGINYRPIEETLKDSLEDLKARSWL